MKQNHFIFMFPIISVVLTGCGTWSNNDYYGPNIVDDNSKTISNYSSYPVTIIYPDGQVILFPDNSQTFYNEDPDKKWDVFQTSFSYRYNENLVTMERGGDWSVTFYDKIIDDEETDITKNPESNAPVNTFEIAENNLEKQSPEILTEIPTPDFAQNAPGVNTIPDAKTAVKNPQTDYADHVPRDEPVIIPDIVPQQSHDPLPLISNFRKGMYYVQIGSYANVNTVYAEIAKIDNSLPVAVMRTTVRINGVNKEVHRVLIGPLDYRRSHLLLRQFRVNYRDAFVWQGR